jgi:hypothetical protein
VTQNRDRIRLRKTHLAQMGRSSAAPVHDLA